MWRSSTNLEDPFAPFRLVTFHHLAYKSPNICRLRNGSKSQPRVIEDAGEAAGGDDESKYLCSMCSRQWTAK